SGPSMNILIKLTCLVGLVIAPILGNHSNENTGITAISSTSEDNAKFLDAEGNYIYDLGEIQPIVLSSGKELEVGRRSTEQKLYRFLSRANNNDKSAQMTRAS